MHIQTTKNPRGQKYYHLVESYWENGKSKKRMLLSLGKAGEDKIDSLAEAITRHRDLMTATELAKELSIDKTFILGPLLILEKLFERLGINNAIQDVLKKHPKVECSVSPIEPPSPAN